MHKQHWFEEMINNRNKSVVTDMKWTPNGEKIGIVYEDGAVIVGSVEGTRLWGKDLDIRLKIIEWSPDSRTILFGTPDGAVNVFDFVGNFQYDIKISCLRGLQGDTPLAAIEWYDHNRQGFSYEDSSDNSASLCIAYQCGRMQLMRKLDDRKPYLIDTGMFIRSCKWNPNGNVLAVCGSMSENGTEAKGVIQFYSSRAQHLRTLRVPGNSGVVSSMDWEGYGLRIVLCIDSNVLFANIQPDYMWSYFNDTIVFAYRKPERNDMCITFWNTKVNEKSVKYAKSLTHVKSSGDYCILVSKLHDPHIMKDTWMIQLCNAIGCPVESKNICIEPKYVEMNNTHVIVANEDTVYYWQYRSPHSKAQSLE